MRWQDLISERSAVVAAKIIALSTAVGAIIGALRSSGEGLVTDILFGALIGCVISVGCIVVEFQLFSNQRHRFVRRLRPILLVALRGAAFSFFIVLGLSLPGLMSDALPLWQDPEFPEVFVISIAIAYSFSVGFEITRLLGPEATMALIWGRYNKARLESRVIVFADVIGSTALAEKIGQLRFHDFLRDIALDIAGPIEMTQGGIHKYAGDAVIITWPLARGMANDACLKCAQEMHRVLESRDHFYLNTYGIEARIRVAIHCGEVAAGEIGDWKKEIALLGDPMNTAARIEEAAKAFKVSIAVSDDIAAHLNQEARNRLIRLPEFAAMGKRKKLILWSAPLA